MIIKRKVSKGPKLRGRWFAFLPTWVKDVREGELLIWWESYEWTREWMGHPDGGGWEYTRTKLYYYGC